DQPDQKPAVALVSRLPPPPSAHHGCNLSHPGGGRARVLQPVARSPARATGPRRPPRRGCHRFPAEPFQRAPRAAATQAAVHGLCARGFRHQYRDPTASLALRLPARETPVRTTDPTALI